mmetsp:Transcript_15651/g.37073  ORF Transcript_15651/g.37073 Transcript_15651/m.37073 type:complete len:86 (-) Transcript_15651:92-349(-)
MHSSPDESATGVFSRTSHSVVTSQVALTNTSRVPCTFAEWHTAFGFKVLSRVLFVTAHWPTCGQVFRPGMEFKGDVGNGRVSFLD